MMRSVIRQSGRENQGSVAAPTASLNMTDEILSKLKKKGVQIAYLTLHVGLGTFMPIRTDDVETHHMHQEYFEIPTTTIKRIKDTKTAGGRVIALGTTVARTLEYSHQLLGFKQTQFVEKRIFLFIQVTSSNLSMDY